MDFRSIVSFLGVDENEAEELGRLLADTLASDLAKIRQSLKDDDLDAVAFVTHSIKGAAGNLGFGRPAQLAATLETLARAGQGDGLDDLVAELQIFLDALNSSLAGR